MLGYPRPARRPAASAVLAMASVTTALAAYVACGRVPRQVEASTTVPMTDVEMIDRSQVIVHGDVIARSAERTSEDRVVTTYTVLLRERLKPAPAPGAAGSAAAAAGPQTLIFREWGGVAGGIAYWIPGRGDLDVGDEAVLFFEHDPRAGEVGFTCGLARGKVRVRRGAAAAAATRAFVGLDGIDAGALPEPPGPDGTVRSLASWLELIRGRVEGTR